MIPIARIQCTDNASYLLSIIAVFAHYICHKATFPYDVIEGGKMKPRKTTKVFYNLLTSLCLVALVLGGVRVAAA